MLTRLHGMKAVFAFDNWPMLLLGRVFDRKTGFVAYRKNNLDILVDHHGGDECGTRMCIASDMYRKYLPTFALPGPARVLDLGANGGGFPLMLAIEGIELAKVVSVEMNPLTFRRLELNLITNFGTSAVAINAAVCAMPVGSEIQVRPSRGGTGDSMFRDRAGSGEAHVSIFTTTLQELYEKHFAPEPIDLCKIDIEGAEFELFETAPEEVLKKIRYLVMEIHQSPENVTTSVKVLREKLEALGFVDITIPERHSNGRNGNDSHEIRPEVKAFAGPLAKKPVVAQIASRN